MLRSRCILLIVLAATISTPAIAQQKADTTSTVVTRTIEEPKLQLFWATIGGGGVGPGLGGLLKTTYLWGAHSISAKVQAGAELNLWNGPQNDVTEYSIYYGRQFVTPWTMMRVAAGPAYITHTFESTTVHRIGMGAEVEVMVKIYFFGFGFMTSVMAAPDILYGSITANLSLGKLF